MPSRYRYFFRRDDGLWEERFIESAWLLPRDDEDLLEKLDANLIVVFGAGNYYIVPPTEATRPEEV